MSYVQADYSMQSAGTSLTDTAAAGPSWIPDAPSAADQDSWLVSFVDVLTLLLTLFVLLLAWESGSTGFGGDIAPDSTNPVEHPQVITPEHLNVTHDESVLLHRDNFTPATVTTSDWHFANLYLHRPADIEELTIDIDAETSGAERDPVAGLAQPAELELPEQYPDSQFTIDWLGMQDGPAMSLVAMPDTRESGPADLFMSAIQSMTETSPLSVDDSEVDPADLTPFTDTTAELEPPLESRAGQEQATSSADNEPLTDTSMVDQFMEAFRNSELNDLIELTTHAGAVNLEISESILFRPASIELTDIGLSLLEKLAATLATLPYALSVEGHTDNVPISSTRFPSNWELSSARATIVTRHLVRQGISPDRIRAIGYADTRPRAENLTPEGRTRNRRVSLVLEIPGGR